ncbi:HAD family hydrolase [Arthrobacter pigmenti]
MSPKPTVVVFDVNETLSDMTAIKTRFEDVGAPAYLSELWFASVLRDGFALAAAGTGEKFVNIASAVLRNVLETVPVNRRLEDAVSHVMEGFSALPVHPGVVDGVRDLAAIGFRLVTLTNGSVDISRKLLTSAGIRDEFEMLLSVDDAGAWKPAGASYAYASRAVFEEPAQMLLVAVHPWDIDGASKAGLQTAWINRTGAEYPPHFSKPDHTLTAITELAEAIEAGE